ncbi:MAG: BMP family ABC transporter substrate-binding protein [Oscillospiraceae bacterium]|nr:BMP family ABC transporter substrate-binding protein [Oscillospiraceae bacterium]
MNKILKKSLTAALLLSMTFGMTSCGGKAPAQGGSSPASGGDSPSDKPAMKMAMITDYGDITDQSFNQTTYEACRKYADENNKEFTYYKPASDSDADRVAMIDKAIADGYDVIVLPGFSFAGPVVECAPNYPDIKFVTLDITEGDFCSAAGTDSYSQENVFGAVYAGDISGYLAGYTAVKLGYHHLGFLGGMAVPGVVQFGQGYVKGIDDAAAETGEKIVLDYAYANQFYGDADITAAMETWYQGGTEVVFACGGGVYTSPCEAAQPVGGKMIGVDVDQKPVIDGTYGEGITVTSALKGLAPTVKTVLNDIENGKWSEYGGKIRELGLVSADDLSLNYVGLSESTQWSDKFTLEDYKATVKSIIDGERNARTDNTSETPTASNITINYQGNLK